MVLLWLSSMVEPVVWEHFLLPTQLGVLRSFLEQQYCCRRLCRQHAGHFLKAYARTQHHRRAHPVASKCCPHAAGGRVLSTWSFYVEEAADGHQSAAVRLLRMMFNNQYFICSRATARRTTETSRAWGCGTPPVVTTLHVARSGSDSPPHHRHQPSTSPI